LVFYFTQRRIAQPGTAGCRWKSDMPLGSFVNIGGADKFPEWIRRAPQATESISAIRRCFPQMARIIAK